MNKPSLDILLKKVDSRYTLVVAAAKRARMLTYPESSAGTKPVSRALEEIAADRLQYERTKSGIK
ncbi:DNA-directed RNA polymerase subunit omega [Carboxydocella sp. ULO1]|uniref:DNA-directed RNA polymerase subunit omega n=1 Tax=Carboxydocella sp. ULO1 TaxID=1926599 RepID=UPI0009CE0A4E|nr:DNA-directed RNA polymerase subunit omega [Carboxydocella sp. ULO1]GAW30115.1 DNA-directed RNA polymerase subunit omega [Carboxydocella sp. ULO1]